ncbi:glutathione S-transferase family protein [Siccirubricoccus sp. KC 17139]|uniref:Glutathione S-transferase family protein n=1 Tax=Siccirubricoccus soli TaxID=2899147 RepID=A0ABT1D0U1_9PROT|nr:glutathione S-transferase family protein [Siccirubricoccus soli]MCO6415538.1 glutathione S-transferase family protein [Siccirubricoccus soli]MCP2681670.1 glutathione S-transferase family protein [Siccirubricoccus soli]
MAYILYGDRRSGSSIVELALAEIGAEAELRPVPLASDAQLAAGYRQLNPMGRVPTLILPDGTVVTESTAILLTLEARHPAAGLLPPGDDPGRAVALRWMMLAASEIYPCVTRYDYPDRFGDAPESIRRCAVGMAQEIWRLIEASISPAPFLLGGRPTLADLYLAVLSRWMGCEAWMPEHCPKLQSLARAVATRPQLTPAWRRHFELPQ